MRILTLALLAIALPITLRAATLPADFTESTVVTGLASPVSFEIAPDGRIFICEKGGALRVYKDGKLLPKPFVTLEVDSNGDRGLQDIAFHPDFPTTPYIYALYTTQAPHPSHLQ